MQNRSRCALVGALLLAQGAMARPLKQIIESKRLNVTLTEHDYVPFYGPSDNGKLAGFDIEFAQQLAEALDVELVLHRESQSYPSFVGLLLRDKTDVVISAYQITLERAKEIKFSTPYFRERRVFVAQSKNANSLRRDCDQIRRANPEASVTVGLLEKSTYRTFFAHHYPGANIHVFANPQELLNAVKGGTVRFGYLSESIVNQWLREHKSELLYLRKYYVPEETDAIAVGVHPDYEQLLYWINTFITTKESDGSLGRLATKYFKDGEFKNHELPHEH